MNLLQKLLRPSHYQLTDDEFVHLVGDRVESEDRSSKLAVYAVFIIAGCFAIWVFWLSSNTLRTVAESAARTAGLPKTTAAICVLVGFALGAVFGQFVASMPMQLARRSEERRTVRLLLLHYGASQNAKHQPKRVSETTETG